MDEVISIPLNHGKIALIDKCDLNKVKNFKWRARKDKNTWYARRTIHVSPNRKTTQLMHRLILEAPPYLAVDHINGDGLDNRRSNLRLCTSAENARNRRSWGRSKFKGVYWFKPTCKWHSKIKIEGKRIDLGLYEDEIEAARVYDAAAKKYFGSFAWLNFKENRYA